MKTRKLIYILITLLGVVACEKEETAVTLQEEDAYYINHFFEQHNIPGGYLAGELQSTTIVALESVVDPSTGAVVAGDTLEKRAATFNKHGYITTLLDYSIPGGEELFMLTARVDYTYDAYHRIASEMTTTGGSPFLTRERKVYTYDNKAGTATEVTSIATGDDPFLVIRKVIYQLKKNGFIDDNLYEVVSTRASMDDLPLAPTLSIDFVVVQRDERDNWTRAYSRVITRDRQGNETGRSLHEYFARDNIYFK
ncbi:MAG: hypothetical protein LBD64_07405 [Odoribacteraceae bacterium]|jgi:hypothetical protein|nr:hypothetical protein [Odoribacteraceae bacterium]